MGEREDRARLEALQAQVSSTRSALEAGSVEETARVEIDARFRSLTAQREELSLVDPEYEIDEARARYVKAIEGSELDLSRAETRVLLWLDGGRLLGAFVGFLAALPMLGAFIEGSLGVGVLTASAVVAALLAGRSGGKGDS